MTLPALRGLRRSASFQFSRPRTRCRWPQRLHLEQARRLLRLCLWCGADRCRSLAQRLSFCPSTLPAPCQTDTSSSSPALVLMPLLLFAAGLLAWQSRLTMQLLALALVLVQVRAAVHRHHLPLQAGLSGLARLCLCPAAL